MDGQLQPPHCDNTTEKAALDLFYAFLDLWNTADENPQNTEWQFG